MGSPVPALRPVAPPDVSSSWLSAKKAIPTEITDRHYTMWRDSVETQCPVVDLRSVCAHRNVYELSIMAKERQGLLAEVSDCLRNSQLSILSAKIFSLPNDSVMDLFRIYDGRSVLEGDDDAAHVYGKVLEIVNRAYEASTATCLEEDNTKPSDVCVPNEFTPSEKPLSPRPAQQPSMRQTSGSSCREGVEESMQHAEQEHNSQAEERKNVNRDESKAAPSRAQTAPGKVQTSKATSTDVFQYSSRRASASKSRKIRREYSNLALYNVEAEAQDEGLRRSRDAELAHLRKGEVLYLYSPDSHHRYSYTFRISENLKNLEWDKGKSVDFKSCHGVVYGPKTGTFSVLDAAKRPDEDWLCFSLLVRKSRDAMTSMDFAASSDEQVTRWVCCLQYLCHKWQPERIPLLTRENCIFESGRMKVRHLAKHLGETVPAMLTRVAIEYYRNKESKQKETQRANASQLSAEQRRELLALRKELRHSLDRETILKNRLKDTQAAWEIDFVREVALGERIGKGAYSDIWKATWRASVVACKVLRAQDTSDKRVREFYEEVKLTSKFRHPNIVLFMAACPRPPHFCILTEFCFGGNVYSALRRVSWRRLDHRALVRIARDIARGLLYLHACNIVHRDVKSQNILLDRPVEEGTPVAKICDFGLSRELVCGADDDPDGGIMTNETGTYRWMAPEMIRHERYNEKVDVYSYGVTVWELFTCEFPFANFSPIQAAFAVADKGARPVALTEYGRANPIPLAWNALINWCWATRPADRPRLDQVVEALNRMEFQNPDILIPSVIPNNHVHQTTS
ncbi:Serine/threonine-protein kinase STY8 [Porphyridium purpureum]|uniref:non-specific serine/threonine protein kinase n=1 Tax=Porphyridium purpureum TaxID=35688 RepID=A0A5J4YT60_PORPP|nr:Serine/threonine-protein kinase STY8 [Porphyridium purpureum]|eukprot:POR0239..scf229_5